MPQDLRGAHAINMDTASYAEWREYDDRDHRSQYNDTERLSGAEPVDNLYHLYQKH